MANAVQCGMVCVVCLSASESKSVCSIFIEKNKYSLKLIQMIFICGAFSLLCVYVCGLSK